MPAVTSAPVVSTPTAPVLNTGTSIVDFLKSSGGDSSFAGRTALATKYGITGYTGTADQNNSLLAKVQSGQSTGTTGGVSGAAAGATTGTTGTSTMTAADAHTAINGGQADDQSSATDSSGDTPPTRGSVESIADITKDVVGAITPTTAKPAVPNETDQYNALRTTYGVDDLESSLSDLNAQATTLKNALSVQKGSEENKAVPMNVIEGRESEETNQTNAKLGQINDQIAAISGQLQTKYAVIDNVMKYTQQDYTNASDDYDKQYTENLSTFNTVKGIEDDEITAQDKAQDDARSNLQIIYNNLSTGTVDPSTISPAESATISKLETQAGLPQGFYTQIVSKNPTSSIVSTTTRTTNGTKYADVIIRAQDGTISTQSISLGADQSSSSATDAKSQGYSDINGIISNAKATTTAGKPVVDSSGKLTADGFTSIVNYGATVGISRADILAQYSGYLDKTKLAQYGLTTTEQFDVADPNATN